MSINIYHPLPAFADVAQRDQNCCHVRSPFQAVVDVVIGTSSCVILTTSLVASE